MIFKTINATACLGAALVCLASPQLEAATFGSFTYTEDLASITIDGGPVTGHVTIPTTINGKPVKMIAEGAFRHNRSITGVTIPAGVTFVGNSAFMFCANLTSVEIPASVTFVGYDAFSMCGKLKSAVFGEGTTSIPRAIFSGNRELENVIIPSSVTEIGADAFGTCRKLKTIAIPKNLKTLGAGAFSNTGITSFSIPATVENLGIGVFRACLDLETVTLPDHLEEIPDEMFFGCPKLQTPVIPAKVKRIGKGAFSGSGLYTISLPASVRLIDDFAFQKSSNFGPNNLVSVLLNGDAPTLGKKVFENTPTFSIFIQSGTKGYTVPKWNGYRIATPKPEIVVTTKQVNLTTGVSSTKFGNVLVGAKSPAVRFTIQNVGNRKLTQLAAKIKDGASKDFQVSRLGKSSLAPGKSTFVDVVFTPTKKGSRVSKLQIRSNDADEGSFEVEVRGVGLVNVK